MEKKVAYFQNGMLCDLSPHDPAKSLHADLNIAYQADVIVSDGSAYDLYKVSDIQALPTPAFIATWDIAELSYVFKIRCGLVTDPSLIPAFVDKALELMRTSCFIWRRRDYLQVIRNYHRMGLVEAGDRAEFLYRRQYPHLFSSSEDATHEGEHLSTKYYFENKLRRYHEYELIKAKFPDAVPKTIKGYLQMRTRQTARFLDIKEQAEMAGISVDLRDNLHFCRKLQRTVIITKEYDHSGRYAVLTKCTCSYYEESHHSCGGKAFGLNCVYPAP